MKNPILITVLVAVVVAAAAFFAGMQYQKMQRGNGFAGSQANRIGGGVNRGNNRPVAGQILTIDEKSITVKLMDGSSKIVLLSDSTSITEATAATKQALLFGQQVLVFGSTNSDGSVTAQNIQLNPMFGRNMIASPSGQGR